MDQMHTMKSTKFMHHRNLYMYVIVVLNFDEFWRVKIASLQCNLVNLHTCICTSITVAIEHCVTHGIRMGLFPLHCFPAALVTCIVHSQVMALKYPSEFGRSMKIVLHISTFISVCLCLCVCACVHVCVFVCECTRVTVCAHTVYISM